MAPKSGISRFAGKTPKGRVLAGYGPIKTPLGLPAAVQEGFLGWGNGLYRSFRVATGKTRFAPILGVELD